MTVTARSEDDAEPAAAAVEESEDGKPDAAPEAEAEQRPTAVPIGDDEEILELSDEEREAVPTRSDDQG